MNSSPFRGIEVYEKCEVGGLIERRPDVYNEGGAEEVAQDFLALDFGGAEVDAEEDGLEERLRGIRDLFQKIKDFKL